MQILHRVQVSHTDSLHLPRAVTTIDIAGDKSPPVFEILNAVLLHITHRSDCCYRMTKSFQSYIYQACLAQ